ncbi:hypothetical protein, partial [Legionella drozanskii]|uniref:hypothetical protein n=1 Tax=Legionella drozanskii TaxID=96228 RepID=UPI00104130E7
MAYCKKFIDGINLINFADESAELLRDILIHYAINDLKTNSEKIKEDLERLPLSIPDNKFADEQLKIYREKQEALLKHLNNQVGIIAPLGSALNFEQEPEIDIDKFISNFAVYFRNLQHLSDTLSDAPPQIKNLQTRLYIEVLFKLDQSEQESQLQTPFLDLNKMINKAMSFYEATTDEKLRIQSHKLVQMATYELVRRECEKITATNSIKPRYRQYQDFLNVLTAQIPEVGKSAIFDNISDYRGAAGKSISDLLSEVEKKLKISPSENWDNTKKINAFIERKYLFNKLRFGQEDRREYAKKVRKNAEKDLFWARGQIRDIELFTESSLVDRSFANLTEIRYLKRDKKFKLLNEQSAYEIVYKASDQKVKPQAKKRGSKTNSSVDDKLVFEDTLKKQKLEVAFEAVREARGTERKGKTLFAKGDATSPFQEASKDRASDKDTALATIRRALNKNFDQPVVEVLDGIIRVSVFSFNQPTQKIAETLLGNILPAGFGLGAYSMVLRADSSAITCHSFTGRTILDIEKQVIALFPQCQASGYLAHFSDIKRETKAQGEELVRHLELTDLRKIQLLSRLLELNLSAPYLTPQINFPQEIAKAFLQIRDKNYLAALEIPGLKTAVDNIFSQLKPLTGFAKVKKEVEDNVENKISQLDLNNNDQILLCKLVELRFFYSQLKSKKDFPVEIKKAFETEKLQKAFNLVGAGRYSSALKMVELEEEVDELYKQIAKLKETDIPKYTRSTVDKAKILSLSEGQRKEKIKRLRAVFASDEEPAGKIEGITKIFLEEYLEMSKTLGLSKEEQTRTKDDLHLMAEELVELMERTAKGEPALKNEEQAAYFSAIKQIAEKIAPKKIEDVHFKIPYTSKSPLTIKVIHNFDEIEVEIDLNNVKLPYSLTKPPGKEEFILSYGGSRGVIAPFEGFDSAYASPGTKKKRLFTHLRLLGVGQYAAVKEVEDLLNGLNKAMKKGFIPTSEKTTFEESSFLNPRTRPLASRNDSHYLAEYHVVENLLRAEKKDQLVETEKPRTWKVTDKLRPKGALYSEEGRPIQYRTLIPRAKGKTFADAVSKKLNSYAKNNIGYHDPVVRSEEGISSDLKEMLALAQAVLDESMRLEDINFTHNDIKPENFLFRKNAEGSYQVKYIDWATGGFSREYEGEKKTAPEVFAEVFGPDSKFTGNNEQCADESGRFVEIDIKGQIKFGINPVLEILHGERNGTLPYISPKVLGVDRKRRSIEGRDPSYNTSLNAGDTSLDDWALTAMTFGICNRQAYFALVKGRAVNDYIVPGILEADDQKPLGLKVVSIKDFNQFFACGADVASDENLASQEFYNQLNAVMYIPSNQREGEPMHLYRRLIALQEQLKKKMTEASSPEAELVKNIEGILSTVHDAVASGDGLKKSQLKEQFNLAQRCLQDYDKLQDKSYQKSQKDIDILNNLINQYEEEKERKEEKKGKELSFYDLLKRPQDKSLLEILCTFPNTRKQKKVAVEILTKVIDQSDFTDNFLNEGTSGSALLIECIAGEQDEILVALLSKITEKNPLFIQYVEQHALLHYAADQGLNSVFTKLIETLQTAGASEDKIFELLLNEYGPGSNRKKGAPYIKWATSCLDIIIRNNNPPQLEAILKIMPADVEEKAIQRALHLCAALGNKAFFDEIIKQYNDLNPDKKLGVNEIIGMKFPPDDLSPYHLFLRDAATSYVIDELAVEPKLAHEFLAIESELLSPIPTTIAAENGNFSAITKLVQLASKLELSGPEWVKFFTQSDEHGKTVLNYILEKGQLEYLTTYIATIKEICPQDSATILVHLLSNTDPVNPLKNYLNTKAVNPSQQFDIVKLLLDSICDNYKDASEEQQRARIVALLVNREWFITQAQSSIYHDQLRDLLQNSALSFSAKKFLFDKLNDAAPHDSAAKLFYEKLLGEVNLQAQEVGKEPIQVDFPQVMVDLAKQTSDVSALIRALVDDHRLENEIKEYEKAKEAIEKELHHLKEDYDGLNEQKELSEKRAQDAEEKLIKTKEEHEVAREFLQKQLDVKQEEFLGEREGNSQLAEQINQLKAEQLKAKEANEAELKRLGEDYEEKLSKQQALLEKQTEQAAEILSAAKEEHEVKRELLQKELDAKQKEFLGEHEENSQLAEQINQLKAEQLKAKEANEAELKRLGEDYDKKLSKQQELSEKRVQDAEERLVKAKEEHEVARELLQKELDAKQEEFLGEHEENSQLAEEINRLKAEQLKAKEANEAELKRLGEDYDKKLSKQQELSEKRVQDAEERLVKAKEEHEVARELLQKQLDVKQEEFLGEQEGNSQLAEEINQLKAEQLKAKEANEAELKRLGEDYEEKLSKQQALLEKQTEQAAEILSAAIKLHESEQAQLEKELEESKKLLASEQGEKSELTLKVKAIEEELQKANL